MPALALEAGDLTAAERVAAECVVLAETKDHMNWELIGVVAEKISLLCHVAGECSFSNTSPLHNSDYQLGVFAAQSHPE